MPVSIVLLLFAGLAISHYVHVRVQLARARRRIKQLLAEADYARLTEES